jgi:AraC-like DNA-binding protein
VAHVDNEPIQRWSTADVQPSRRLDYFEAAISEAVTPLSIYGANAETFAADISFARLGAVNVAMSSGSPHRSLRGRAELARNSEHVFNLMTTRKAPWVAEHRGAFRMLPRDVFILDSSLPLKAGVSEEFVLLNVGVTETWLRSWVPDPNLLAARRISGDSMWGTALSSYLAQLSPELAAAPPLPLSVISDQVGALLALTASAMHGTAPASTAGARSLNGRIRDCIDERCTEHELTAADVAASVNVSVRTLHRTLSASGETFVRHLIDARSRVAVRMLMSPMFKRVATGEIGRRAGFSSSSHFVRVIRARCGKTPRQLRVSGEPPEAEDEFS